MKQKLCHLTLLVGCYDERNLLRFPSEHPGRPGLLLKFTPDEELETLIAERVTALTAASSEQIELVQIIEEELNDATSLPSSYLALLRVAADAYTAPADWLTLPVILRSLPRGRPRLIYNKAFQLLAGADQGDIAALEIDDEVKRRLQDLAKNDKL